ASNPTDGAVSYTVTDEDRAAVRGATPVRPHVLRRQKTNGIPARDVWTAHRNSSKAAPDSDTNPLLQVAYPADLTFQGGHVLDHAQQHAIYMLPNGVCPISTCWGDPEGFLGDLSRSEFIHITDQYVGTSAFNRYPVGARAFISFVA